MCKCVFISMLSYSSISLKIGDMLELQGPFGHIEVVFVINSPEISRMQVAATDVQYV